MKAKKVVQKSKTKFISFMEWVLYLVGYTLVFILVTSLFRTIYIKFFSKISFVIIYFFCITFKKYFFSFIRNLVPREYRVSKKWWKWVDKGANMTIKIYKTA